MIGIFLQKYLVTFANMTCTFFSVEISLFGAVGADPASDNLQRCQHTIKLFCGLIKRSVKTMQKYSRTSQNISSEFHFLLEFCKSCNKEKYSFLRV